jgi:hypothetical protein
VTGAFRYKAEPDLIRYPIPLYSKLKWLDTLILFSGCLFDFNLKSLRLAGQRHVWLRAGADEHP